MTIDERMVRYTGRLSFLQFIRNKPAQFGIKIFILADSFSGYVYNWKVYTGADGARRNSQNNNWNDLAISSQRNQRTNHAYKIVTELTNILANRNHIVSFDSFYSYLNVVKHLARKGIGSVGTLDKRRRLMPQDIKNPNANMGLRETIFRRSENIMTLVFKDKKFVRIITNVHGN